MQKTILLSAVIISASILISALLIKIDTIKFNITSQVVMIKPIFTQTTVATTVATTSSTTINASTSTTTTVIAGAATCKSPCFDYFQFIDCIDGTLRIKNGQVPITVSEVRGGVHQIKNDNPSYMPGATITITGIPRTGAQEVEINYWDNGNLRLDTATIVN
jgi:hypothetical protein